MTTKDKNEIQSDLLSSDSIELPQLLQLNDSIEVLYLPTRLENLLKRKTEKRRYHREKNKKEILTIQDLLETPESEIRKFRNIGVKTIVFLEKIKRNIKEQIKWEKDKFIQEKTDKKILPDNLVEKSVMDLVTKLMKNCRHERSADIINKRYGLLNGEKETLQEIGDFYGVTRERIRQIQSLTLRRMKRLSSDIKFSLIEFAEKVINKNNGLITEEEVDNQIKKNYSELSVDGSALFDLFSDLNWIQRYEIGDIIIYSLNFINLKLGQLSDKIINTVKSTDKGIDVQSIVRKIKQFSNLQQENPTFNPLLFICRYCKIDPRIEEIIKGKDGPISSVFRLYNAGGTWAFLIREALEKEQIPLHFTEISYKVNDLVKESGKKIEVRRTLAILIENKIFAHSGVKGTYGLTEWGFRKETTPELIEECIKKAGFPLHWKQIIEYVSKFKDTKPANILAILGNNKKFNKIKNGIYGLTPEEIKIVEGEK